ncbi:MAG TPA: glycosyltransferase family 4 protein [Thermomicrobiales bacterium]|nr:glycosyltransferase family 4 protein [Thermomicrobiales bacterium]
MNILVLHTQVPFVRGGAEVLVDGLVKALRERDHTVDVVALPLAWNPPEGLLTTALAWRMLDLARFNDRAVDRVICTKFPTWAVEHECKSLWLIHQHRQAYDLYGTKLSEFTPDPASRETRDRVVDIDSLGIADCAPRFGISRNVCDRLRRYNGLDATPLYPPVPRAGLRAEAYEPFILSAARLDDAKRVEPAIRAMAHVPRGLRLEIVGDGPNRHDLELLARSLGVDDRVTFRGRVSDDALQALYNTCSGVYYAPVDEDYGYSTVEALQASKPVVTAPDSGGVLEFVTDSETGIVTSLDGEALGAAFGVLADPVVARRLGEHGPALTANLTWDIVVESLLDG